MFIKREDLVDMLEVIDCENGYVDLDHLVECCNNLPSSGMSVWCMKCENNGECMTIDKPNCFQPRQADTPQTDCEDVWRAGNKTGYDKGFRDAQKAIDSIESVSAKTEPSGYNLKPVEDEPQTDCAWR